MRGGYTKGSVIGKNLGEKERAEGEEEGFGTIADCQQHD